MNRTIDVELSRFPSVPPMLVDPLTNAPVRTLGVALKTLFHHYFVAKYGDAVDSGTYEYERHLTAGLDWRFRGAGIGVDKEAKRNVSNELGKAFARWFHSEYFGFTYFCPFERVVGTENADGSKWRRKSEGDLPDYVCGIAATDVNLLEAKGRYHSVTFRTKEFDGFREQVQRAQLVDAAGHGVAVKSYISVARWGTEETPRVRSKLLVEDPSTEGEPPGARGYPRDVGLSMIAGHYGPVLERLELPVHAGAIRDRQRVPEQTGARRGIWRCIAGPLKDREFVGGVVPDRFVRGWDLWWPSYFDEGMPRHFWRVLQHGSPFLLAPPMRFFGLERSVMESVVAVARRGLEAAEGIEPVTLPERPGSLSLLRDGTVLAPADYFEPIGVMDL